MPITTQMFYIDSASHFKLKVEERGRLPSPFPFETNLFQLNTTLYALQLARVFKTRDLLSTVKTALDEPTSAQQDSNLKFHLYQ